MKIHLRSEHDGATEERTWPEVRSDVLARALIETIFRLAPDTMCNFWEKDGEVALLTRGPFPDELRRPDDQRGEAIKSMRRRLAVRDKICTFLSHELALKNHRRCVELSLSYVLGDDLGTEALHAWTQANLEQTNAESLASVILDMAEREAVTIKLGAAHRFLLRSNRYADAIVVSAFDLPSKEARDVR